jgi:hypothetical protein
MAAAKPSSLVDTRVVYCGDNLDQLKNLPEACTRTCAQIGEKGK